MVSNRAMRSKFEVKSEKDQRARACVSRIFKQRHSAKRLATSTKTICIQAS